jgi:hypothetical protein
MKKLIITAVLLVSSLAFSSEPHEAHLDLNLSVDRLCDQNAPFCSVSSSISFGGVKVPLIAQNGDEICDAQTGECSTGNITHYRGIWSKVVENDGVRSIAIVSIDKHLYQNDDPSDNSDDDVYSYSIEAEIVGEKGTEAKLRLNTNDLKNLNSVTLEGPVKNIMQNRYQASLRVGRALVLIPIPCPVDNPNDLCDENRDNDSTRKVFSNNEIELLMGTLK